MTGIFPPRMPSAKRLLMTALLLDAQVQATAVQRKIEAMFEFLLGSHRNAISDYHSQIEVPNLRRQFSR